MAESKDARGCTSSARPLPRPRWRGSEGSPGGVSNAKLVQYDPAIAGTAAQSAQSIQYSLTEADVVVSLDADFSPALASLDSTSWCANMRAAQESEKLNRLYSIESTPTTTGFKASIGGIARQ